jgi:hypothetical protein
VSSFTEEEHLADLDQFLATMVHYGLKLKPEKCRIAQAEIRYLGHLISANGVRIDPKDLEPIMKLRKPNSTKELRSLIGMIAYFRKFIFGFAELMQPLYDLTKYETTAKWEGEHDQLLEMMKEKLTSAPVLAPPRLGDTFTLETDASILAIAAVLLQKDKDDNVHPVAYFSRTLNKFERKYAIVELEALAIAASVRYFKPYIEGSHTIVITDNSALTSLMRRKDLEGRLARYQLSIMSADLEIKYRPGRFNKVADVLSRNFQEKEENIVLAAIKMTSKVTAKDIRTAQKEDDKIKQIYETLQQEIANGMTNCGKFILWKDLVCIEEKSDPKIVVPKVLQQKVMTDYHEDPIQGGHLGIRRTLEKIRRSLYWDGIARDVHDFVAACHNCQMRKIDGKNASREPICPIEPASGPFQRIHADFMGPVQTAPGGFRYVLVFVDSFSKFLICIPMREQKAIAVAEATVNHVICRFGTPKIIITDCGTNFMSSTFQDLAKTLHFNHETSTPYHQAANGQCERYMRTIADMVATTTKGKDWNKLLPKLCFAYNSSVNFQIGYSPFFVIHGWEPLLSSEAALDKDQPRYEDMSEYIFELVQNLTKARDVVMEKLHKNADKMIELQEDKTNPLLWVPGMQVLIKRVTHTGKFEDKFDGPYHLLAEEGSNLIVREMDENSTSFPVHKDRCKPYIPRDIIARDTELTKDPTPTQINLILISPSHLSHTRPHQTVADPSEPSDHFHNFHAILEKGTFSHSIIKDIARNHRKMSHRTNRHPRYRRSPSPIPSPKSPPALPLQNSEQMNEARCLMREGERITDGDRKEADARRKREEIAQLALERRELELQLEEAKRMRKDLAKKEQELKRKKDENKRKREWEEKTQEEKRWMREQEETSKRMADIFAMEEEGTGQIGEPTEEGIGEEKEKEIEFLKQQPVIMQEFENRMREEEKKERKVQEERKAFEKLQELFGKEKAGHMWRAGATGIQMARKVMQPTESVIVSREPEEGIKRKREEEAEEKANAQIRKGTSSCGSGISIISVESERKEKEREAKGMKGPYKLVIDEVNKTATRVPIEEVEYELVTEDGQKLAKKVRREGAKERGEGTSKDPAPAGGPVTAKPNTAHATTQTDPMAIWITLEKEGWKAV